jgi:hypothetical protein
MVKIIYYITFQHLLYKFQLIQEEVSDIEDIKCLSLEETKVKAEHDKRIAEASQRKQNVLQRLEELKINFRDIISR